MRIWILGVLLLTPSISFGAIAFDAVGTGNGAVTTTASATLTVASSTTAIAIVCAASTGGAAPSAMTFGGSAMTAITNVGSGANTLYAYYLIAPSSGSQTATVTYVSSTTITLTAATYIGVTQASPIDTSGSGAGAGGTATANVTTAVDNDMLSACYSGTGGTGSITTGTNRNSNTTAPNMYWNDKAVTPAGAASFVGTGSFAAGSNIIAVAFKPLVTFDPTRGFFFILSEVLSRFFEPLAFAGAR